MPFCYNVPLLATFSRMVDIKAKKRNRLCRENDMRVGTCQGEAAHFWTCPWKATAKATLSCSKYSMSHDFILVWNSHFLFLWLQWSYVQLMHGLCCALTKHIPMFWRNIIYLSILFTYLFVCLSNFITRGSANARMEFAVFCASNKV